MYTSLYMRLHMYIILCMFAHVWSAGTFSRARHLKEECRKRSTGKTWDEGRTQSKTGAPDLSPEDHVLCLHEGLAMSVLNQEPYQKERFSFGTGVKAFRPLTGSAPACASRPAVMPIVVGKEAAQTPCADRAWAVFRAKAAGRVQRRP